MTLWLVVVFLFFVLVWYVLLALLVGWWEFKRWDWWR